MIKCYAAFADEESHIELLIDTVKQQRKDGESFRLGCLIDSDKIKPHRELYPEGLIDNENEVVIWSNMSVERLQQIMKTQEALADLRLTLIDSHDYRGQFAD